MALCSDAELDADGNVTGEPTEAALVVWANRIGQDKNLLKQSMPCDGGPFDSGRKMMSTVHKRKDDYIQFTKGYAGCGSHPLCILSGGWTASAHDRRISEKRFYRQISPWQIGTVCAGMRTESRDEKTGKRGCGSAGAGALLFGTVRHD